MSQVNVQGRTKEECVTRILELDVTKQYMADKSQNLDQILTGPRTKSILNEPIAEIDPISFFVTFLLSAKVRDEKFYNSLFFAPNNDLKKEETTSKQEIKYYPIQSQRKLPKNAAILSEKLKKLNNL